MTTATSPSATSVGQQAAARTEDAVKVYGKAQVQVRALDAVTVEFAAGRYTAIMGPSGSGKSTLLHCVAGLDTLTSGKAYIGDADLSTLNDQRLTILRRDHVGFVFQSFNLVPTITAAENITLPLLLAGRKGDKDWIAKIIETLGIGNRLQHRPQELSGGQQQRVAVARALASRPEIIFADEPTGNLDSHAGAEVLTFMRRAVDEMGQTIVMVTHDPIAASYADRIVFLADGRIVDEMRRADRRAGARAHEAVRGVSPHVQGHHARAAGPQVPAVRHRPGGDARRGVHGRDDGAHRHHRAYLQRPVHRRVQGHRRGGPGQGRLHRARDGRR